MVAFGALDLAAELATMRRLALTLFLLGACGYRFTAGGGGLPGGIREVYAPVFINRTAEPGLETLFTQSMREQLERAGVAGTASSETQLIGELQSVFGAPTLASFRLTAQLSVRLVRNGVAVPNGAVVVSGQEEYLAGRNILESETNRAAALRRLATTLTRDAYDRLATQ